MTFIRTYFLFTLFVVIGKPLILLEYCQGGTLESYLKLIKDTTKECFSNKTKGKFALDIAKGMRHLEEAKVRYLFF